MSTYVAINPARVRDFGRALRQAATELNACAADASMSTMFTCCPLTSIASAGPVAETHVAAEALQYDL